MKRFFLLMMFVLSFSNIYSYVSDYPYLDPNEYLDEKTYSDLIIEISAELKQDNYTREITLLTDTGVRFMFVGNIYMNSTFPRDGILFGVYSHGSKTIAVNVESISNYLNETNHTQEEINLKIFNTLQHEITHYLDFTGKIPDIAENLGIEYSTYPMLSNYDIFKFLAIESITDDIPDVLRSTINFQNLFPPYPDAHYETTDQNAEIIARLMAICITENQDYTNYWDMLIYSDYAYCNNITFSANIDNAYNGVYSELLVAHARVYNPEILSQTYQTEQNIKSGFFVINVITSNVLHFFIDTMSRFYILTFVLSIVSLVFMGFSTQILSFIDRMIKKK